MSTSNSRMYAWIAQARSYGFVTPSVTRAASS